VVRLIQTAQRMKAPSQRFTDRFGTGYTWVILGLAGGMFLLWWLGFGHAPFRALPGEPSAFYHAMTLLVVASPCALVLSIPSAVLAAIATGARRGVLFRGGAAVEKLGEVNVVAMDKTGTLTTGELRVEEIRSDPAGKEAEVLRLACMLEQKSTHPLARAVVRHGTEVGVEAGQVEHVESVTGQGIRAEFGGEEVRVGRRQWVLEQGGRAGVFEDTGVGVTEVWIRKGELLGRIVLRDAIRPEAAGLVKRFRELGLRMLVLTGDRPAAAAHLKQVLGLEDVRGELSPEQKLSVVRELAAGGSRVAMIGDGVNDAPSIAAAHVGVAMGARGSDAALEQADLVLMQDRLENFLLAYELSGAARRVIRQNLAVSLGVIGVLMVLALSERLQLTLGVLGHEGSTIVVVLNSLRLLWIGHRFGR
jgi:Cd2+/Zn2+-exporting ATPase